MTRSAVRGSRAGSGPAGEPGDGPRAEFQTVEFWCALGHRTGCSFAVGVEVPERWACRCGRPAGRDHDDAPQTPSTRTGKSHLEYVQDRRDPAAAEELLRVALEGLSARRAGIEV